MDKSYIIAWLQNEIETCEKDMNKTTESDMYEFYNGQSDAYREVLALLVKED